MTTRSGLGRADVARCWAGFASLGAGLVHLAVVQEHLQEWWLYGVFFAVIGAAQILWALAALALDRAPLLAYVLAGNLGLVALWAVTRTTGLPIGPGPWTAEAASRSDVLCVLLELGVAGALFAAATFTASRPSTARAKRPEPAPVGRFLALMFAGAFAVSAVTTPALAATDAGAHVQQHHGG